MRHGPVARVGRIRVVLACSQCGARNYKTTRARTGEGNALSLKKFCKVCNQHTVHIETA
jgi:large subunit ribosomal protein L33